MSAFVDVRGLQQRIADTTSVALGYVAFTCCIEYTEVNTDELRIRQASKQTLVRSLLRNGRHCLGTEKDDGSIRPDPVLTVSFLSLCCYGSWQRMNSCG